MEKINVRNIYIELLNKIKNVQGVDKDYVDGLIELVDNEITALDSDINAITSVIPETASVSNQLATAEDIPAAQVNSDWNADSGIAQILNKPTIPAAQVNSDWNADSGIAQILNKPTIPAAQVNSNWNATSGVAEILNKPTIYKPYYNTFSILSTDWGSSPVSGYYRCGFYLANDDFLVDVPAFVYCVPSSSSAIGPTAAENAAFNLVDKFDFYLSQGHPYLELYAATKPTDNFRFGVSGWMT